MTVAISEEKKVRIKEMLEANPDATLAEIIDGLDEKDAEEQKNLRIEERMEALTAELAKLNKPNPADKKLLDIDPTGTGDPNFGYSEGMKGWGEFAADVMSAGRGKPTEKLLNIEAAEKAAGAGLQENVSSEGGFLIPTEQRTEILEIGLEKSEFMNRCRPMPMQSNTVKINYVNDTDRSGGLIHGGVKMYWVAEEGTPTATKPALGQVTLSLNKLFGLAYATSELIEDSPMSIGPWLSQVFTDAFSWQMDYEIINGSGTGRPEGILNADALVSVAAETNQSSTTIYADNILKMYARMPAANRRNAIWLANEDTFYQLSTMTLDVGTGGVPVYLPANGLANQPFDTLMGKPVIFTEHCQTMGTVGDIFFVDLSQYLLGTKAGGALRADTSIHLKFETDESAFRFIYRVDGRCWWPTYVTPRHSSDTLSPIVGLATRSG